MPKHKNSQWQKAKKLYESYGGFHDVASYRAETGDNTTPDNLITQMIQDDANLRVSNSDKQKREAERERDRLRQQLTNQFDVNLDRDRLAQQNTALRQEYEREKYKRRMYEDVLDPYYATNKLDSTIRYLEKERIKKQVKDELAEELAEKRKLRNLTKNTWGETIRPKSPKRKPTRKKTPKRPKTQRRRVRSASRKKKK